MSFPGFIFYQIFPHEYPTGGDFSDLTNHKSSHYKPREMILKVWCSFSSSYPESFKLFSQAP